MLLVEETSPGVRIVALNRPEQPNAMTAALCQAINLVLDTVPPDDRSRQWCHLSHPPHAEQRV
jgi:enoyl-CoA hydratase/carnithine racemase